MKVEVRVLAEVRERVEKIARRSGAEYMLVEVGCLLKQDLKIERLRIEIASNEKMDTLNTVSGD